MTESLNTSKQCPSCGKLLPEDAVFCGYDGSLLNAKQNDNGSSMVCPKCSKVFPSYARFCPVDSTRLNAEDQGSPEVREEVQEVSQTPQKPKSGTAFMDQANIGAESSLTKTEPPYVQESGQQESWGAPVQEPEAQPEPKAEPAPELVPSPQKEAPVSSSPQTDEHILASTSGYMGNIIGKTVDKYLIQSMLGEGGMAVVYKAHHTIMERTVVIKVMQGWLLSNKKSIERFMRECKVTAKLNHPNIVTVYDVGAINEKAPYLVMEYIKGEALADRIQRQGALSFKTVANIVIQICRGLQEAHNHGIIHRDLKPDNILLQDKSDRPDWVKIVDFGISHFAKGGGQRLTKTGRMVGTPEYIAPEQLKDKPMDNRTDLYAIGIIMYEMLTGKVPFEGESAESILMKHLLEEPTPMVEHKPEFKDGTPFDDIIHRLLQKEPDERFQTATELRLEMEEVVAKMRTRRN